MRSTISGCHSYQVSQYERRGFHPGLIPWLLCNAYVGCRPGTDAAFISYNPFSDYYQSLITRVRTPGDAHRVCPSCKYKPKRVAMDGALRLDCLVMNRAHRQGSLDRCGPLLWNTSDYVQLGSRIHPNNAPLGPLLRPRAQTEAHTYGLEGHFWRSSPKARPSFTGQR
jgi:hypothetical protein